VLESCGALKRAECGCPHEEITKPGFEWTIALLKCMGRCGSLD